MVGVFLDASEYGSNIEASFLQADSFNTLHNNITLERSEQATQASLELPFVRTRLNFHVGAYVPTLLCVMWHLRRFVKSVNK